MLAFLDKCSEVRPIGSREVSSRRIIEMSVLAMIGGHVEAVARSP